MSENNKHQPFVRPLIAIVTDKNDLVPILTEKIVKKLCTVQIISDKNNQKQISEISREVIRFVSFQDIENMDKKWVYSYVIFIILNQEKEEKQLLEEKKIRLAIELSRNSLAKALFIFPLTYSTKSAKKWLRFRNLVLKQEDLYYSIYYLGDLIGPRMNLERKDLLTKMLKGVVEKGMIRIPKSENLLYPVSIENTSKELIRSLLSFGEFGKEIAIVSNKLSAEQLSKIILKQNPGTRLKRSKKERENKRADFQKKISIKQDLDKIIRETITYQIKEKKIISNRINKSAHLKTRKIKKINWPNIFTRKDKGIMDKRKRSVLARLIVKGIALIVVLAVLPLSLILVSSTSLMIGRRSLERGNITVAKRSYGFSKKSSGLLNRYFTLTSIILGGNDTFVLSNNLTNILIESSSLGLKAVSIAEMYLHLMEGVFSEEGYEPTSYLDKIALELDSFYKKSGFLTGELKELQGITKALFERSIEKGSITDIREKAIVVSRIAKNLPEFLGKSRPKNYLVLLQNNLEIRPSGGVIESFALVTFNGGNLSEIEVISTEQADKKLKGKVEPPKPIKDYLGKKSWFFKDSNWNADFSVSAEKAEWFLDKEIDREVDGVIAIDLNFIKALLKETGPITIQPLGVKVDNNNIYFTAQADRENDFFTYLLKETLDRVTKLSDKKLMKITTATFLLLEERNIQIYLHQAEIQKAISELGWDGMIKIIDCDENCQGDWLAIVESNFGEKSGSHLMSREALLEVFFEEGTIKRRLLISIENLSEEKYPSYIRVLSAPTSGFSPVVIKEEKQISQKFPEVKYTNGYKEAGVYVEIEPKEKLILQFSWESSEAVSFSHPGEYRLLWRKQAGIESFPIKVRINVPEKDERLYASEPGLTERETLEYNTKLSRDFVSRIYW